MGQDWYFVNYDKKERSESQGKFGELLYYDTAKGLLLRLFEPSTFVPPPVYVGSPPATGPEVNGEATVKTPDHACKSRLVSLPPELHRHLNDLLDDFADVMSLALTSKYFWDIAQPRIQTIWKENVNAENSWSGDRISMIGDCFGRLPPTLPDRETVETGERGFVRYMLKDYKTVDADRNIIEFTRRARRRLVELPEWDCLPEAALRFIGYPPPLEDSVLRNLTRKEYVRADKVTYTDPNGKGLGKFGLLHFFELQIPWSELDRTSMMHSPGLSLGPWAGHRFDVVDVSMLEEVEMLGDGSAWKDVSFELAKRLEGVTHRDEGFAKYICKIPEEDA